MFHRHHWKLNASHMLMRPYYHSLGGEMHQPITEILWVCRCGRVKTETLDGHWTYEQLQLNPAQVDADKQFLRDLGVRL